MHLTRIVRASEILIHTEKKFIVHPLSPEFVQHKTKHVAVQKETYVLDTRFIISCFNYILFSHQNCHQLKIILLSRDIPQLVPQYLP